MHLRELLSGGGGRVARCNDLCTKEKTGQCALCDALTERDRFWYRWCQGGIFIEGYRALKPIVCESWRWFVLVSCVGVAVMLMGGSWVLDQLWLRNLLRVQNEMLLWGIAITVIALLMVSWKPTVDFWRRYRNTYTLARPPLQIVDLIVVCLGCAFLTGVFLFSPILVQFWLLGTSKAIHIFLGVTTLGGALWGFTSWAWSQRKETASLPPSAQSPGSGDFSDTPITDNSQDLLGRTAFAEGLYQQIKHLPSPESFVFGLHGSWGEGKTSVLNLLQRRLAQDPSLIPVRFNPWYLASEATLIQSFYAAIEQELTQRYRVGGLHRVLSRYGELLTSGLSSLGVKLKPPATPERLLPERLRDELEVWIGRMGRRLVILIDDIDRIAPAEVLAVFKLAGLATRIQNAVFVLSFDVIAVQGMLRDRISVDTAFLEKIVQKPLSLPPAESRDLDQFLMLSYGARRSAIDRFLDELEVDTRQRQELDNHIVAFYLTHLKQLFRTLRDVKRYLNSLRATLPAIVKDVNLYDFVLLEAIQVFAPQLYQDIWRQWWFYIPEGGHQRWSPFSLGRRSPEKAQAIRAHIEELLKNEPRAAAMQAILTELFIEVDQAFSQNNFSSRSRTGNDREEKRITHPDCFDKYFLCRVPIEELADHLIEELIQSWNAEPDTTVASRIADAFQRSQDAGQLVALLNKIDIFRSRIAPERVGMVIRTLYRHAPSFSAGASPLEDERKGAVILLMNLLEKRYPLPTMRILLEEVVREVQSFWFMADVIVTAHSSPYNSFHVHLPAIRTLASERLRTYFIEGHRNFFAEVPEDDWVYVLYYWGRHWTRETGKDFVVVQNYVMSLIDREPTYLKQLFKPLFGKIPLDSFIQAYDPALLKERIDRYGDKVFTTPEEGEVVQKFLQQYAVHQSMHQTLEGAGGAT